MTFLFGILLIAQPSGAASSAPSPTRALYVQPLGSCAGKAPGVDEVVASLRAFYSIGASVPIDVRVLACQELPKAAYYPPRKRYRASAC